MCLIVTRASLPPGLASVGLAAETWSRTLLHCFFLAWALLTVLVAAVVVWRLLPRPSELGRRYVALRRQLTPRLVIALLLASPIVLVAMVTPYAENQRETVKPFRSPREPAKMKTVYCVRVIRSYLPHRPRDETRWYDGGFSPRRGHLATEVQYTSRVAWELIVPTVALMYAGLWWLITYKSQSVASLLRWLLRPGEGQSARDGPPLSRRRAANTPFRDEAATSGRRSPFWPPKTGKMAIHR